MRRNHFWFPQILFSDSKIDNDFVHNLISDGGQKVSIFFTFESLQKNLIAENANFWLIESQ